MTDPLPQALDIKFLRLCCNSQHFPFETTDDLADLEGFVGQNRALTATRLGIAMERDGYNIFALGPAGVGKRSIVLSLLTKEAKQTTPPSDICYVHNFAKPQNPKVMFLHPGIGRKLASDMHQLVDILRSAIPAIFESKAYGDRIKEIQNEARKKQEAAFAELEAQAAKSDIVILRTEDGFMLGASVNGRVLNPEEFQALPEPTRKAKEAIMADVHKKMAALFELIPSWQKEQRDTIKEVIKNFILLQVGMAINTVRSKYQDNKEISSYLTDVEQAILDNPTDFRKPKDGPNVVLGTHDEHNFNRYYVNVLVDNSATIGAPIVYEDLPTFVNLVGHIDHASYFGALTTDFTLIRAGALQRANGGYLLLDARKLLSQPFAWQVLKRALRAKEIRMESFYQSLGYMATTTIEPEPIPLTVKIVLFGDREIYYALCAYDDEFLELFKIGADFDENIAINAESSLLFARLLKSLAKRHTIKPITKDAVMAIQEYAVRLSGDSKKMSTNVRKLTDLLRESDHFASLRTASHIDAPDVVTAIEQQIIRASRVRDEHYEAIMRGHVLLNFDGERVGQINGLSYFKIGDFAFGQPVRISARVGHGRGQIVDIEREVQLGGPIHSKGVLILAGYLYGHYARNEVISLSASLVFEQSYGGVEGDSATAAEACALLSAIAEIPLKQSLAITGSMNQHGEIQAIGGVNEKIEGFFDICAKKDLSGQQGVIIPRANIEHLMLRNDLVHAVRKKQFHLYAVSTIDEAMSLLTGQHAGARNHLGNFPKQSINGRVETALKQFAKKVQAAGKTSRSGAKSK